MSDAPVALTCQAMRAVLVREGFGAGYVARLVNEALALDASGRDAWSALGADRLHVTPTDDLIVHDTSGDGCVCGPTFELRHGEDGDKWLIVHQSLDGRESTEAGS